KRLTTLMVTTSATKC
ncbi:diguanylate cyclase domain protein, partial [Vibrio parahaemolyticus V-223/04]